jgi:ribosomal subunit interface protein
MRISIASPGVDLKPGEAQRIEEDLQKIARHLEKVPEVDTKVRVGNGSPGTYKVMLEVDYRRNHLMAKAENADVGRAVREAREEILRQIKDRSRRGHSSQAKHT